MGLKTLAIGIMLTVGIEISDFGMMPGRGPWSPTPFALYITQYSRDH